MGKNMAFISVAKIDDVAPGKGICVRVGRKSIAVFNVEGNFYALDDFCPHKGAPLVEGYLNATDVTCSWHGASFDLATGNGVGGPCGGGVASYPVRITGDDIELGFEETTAQSREEEDEYDYEEDEPEEEKPDEEEDFSDD